MKKKYRIYLDTSVIGGCLDEKFIEESKKIIKFAKNGIIQLVISNLVSDELQEAPEVVRAVLLSIPKESIEPVFASKAAIELRDAYLAADILTPKSKNDATHVAIATVERVDAIVSWSFKHIVRLDRIKAYNQVNFQNGYGMIQILSPREITFDE